MALPAPLLPRFGLDAELPDCGTAEIPCAHGDELRAQFASTYVGGGRGTFRVGDGVLLVDADGNSNIGGEDYAIAFVDEIEKPTRP
ncbi:hypothetical protein ABIA39_003035 [Nocardia sp. GAS34]|jgi:hypothetical protein